MRLDLSMLPSVAGDVGTMALGGFGGQASFGSMYAVTEQEARSAIAAMALGGGGISWILVGLVVIIIIVIAAAVVIKRRRSTEALAHDLSLDQSEQQF